MNLVCILSLNRTPIHSHTFLGLFTKNPGNNDQRSNSILLYSFDYTDFSFEILISNTYISSFMGNG